MRALDDKKLKKNCKIEENNITFKMPLGIKQLTPNWL